MTELVVLREFAWSALTPELVRPFSNRPAADPDHHRHSKSGRPHQLRSFIGPSRLMFRQPLDNRRTGPGSRILQNRRKPTAEELDRISKNSVVRDNGGRTAAGQKTQSGDAGAQCPVLAPFACLLIIFERDGRKFTVDGAQAHQMAAHLISTLHSASR
jgi:hypothetical protein